MITCQTYYQAGDDVLSEIEEFEDFWVAVAHAGRVRAWCSRDNGYEFTTEHGEDITHQVLNAAKGATRWAKGNYTQGRPAIC